MDDDRFDRLARTLTAGVPRRRVVTGFGSGLAGLLVSGEVTTAKKARKKRSQVRAEAGPCKSPQTRCGKGKNAICTDLRSDLNNCGSCGKVCPGPTSGSGSATCSNGVCGIDCEFPFTPCGTKCADLRSDVNNCGFCGYPCPAGACQTATCSAGNCGTVPNSCPNITGEQCYVLRSPHGCYEVSGLPTREQCEEANQGCGLGGDCYKWAGSSCA